MQPIPQYFFSALPEIKNALRISCLYFHSRKRAEQARVSYKILMSETGHGISNFRKKYYCDID